jgi:hypothetical protein
VHQHLLRKEVSILIDWYKQVSRWQRDTFYKQKLALTSPTSGCRSIGIVRSGTKATETFIIITITGPFNLVSATEELLDRKVAAPV